MRGGGGITYENGANIATSFICSQGATVRTAPLLRRLIDDKNQELLDAKKVHLPKYRYPTEVLTSSLVSAWCKLGIDYAEDFAMSITALDMQRAHGKTIYGNGYLVPGEAVERAEREAVERAEREAVERAEREQCWVLSERERLVVEELKRQKEAGGAEHKPVQHIEQIKTKKTQPEKQICFFDKGDRQ